MTKSKGLSRVSESDLDLRRAIYGVQIEHRTHEGSRPLIHLYMNEVDGWWLSSSFDVTWLPSLIAVLTAANRTTMPKQPISETTGHGKMSPQVAIGYGNWVDEESRHRHRRRGKRKTLRTHRDGRRGR